MTSVRQDLLKALAKIQNHPACKDQDIMTITGFMSDDEVRAHIEANMNWVANWNLEKANEEPKRRKAA